MCDLLNILSNRRDVRLLHGTRVQIPVNDNDIQVTIYMWEAGLKSLCQAHRIIIISIGVLLLILNNI